MVAVVAVVVAVGSYLTWLAGRLDRLAVRVEAARASLDAQLVRRAAAAQAWAGSAPRGAIEQEQELARAAREALAALDAGQGEREARESALSRALRPVLAGAGVAGAGDSAPDAAADVLAAATRVQLARQFHNDAVHALRALRRRRLVRLLRLYGRARPPAYFEIDDALR